MAVTSAVLSWIPIHLRSARGISWLFGLLCALGMVIFMNHTLPAPSQIAMQGGRLVEMQQSIDVLHHGGPPLLGVSQSGSPLAHTGRDSAGQVYGLTGTPYAIGVADDLGMYLYAPVVAHILGESDPREALRVMYIAGAALLAFVYPAIFLTITESLVVSLASPILLFYLLRAGIALIDSYWVPAFISLLALPLLFTLRRRAHVAVWVGFAAVGLLASLSNSVRADSGYGLLIGAAIAILIWFKPWRQRLSMMTVLGAGAIAVYPIGMVAAQAYRDHFYPVSTPAGTTHPFWHPAYLGLGYIQPNPFGITFSDPVGQATANIFKPGVTYLSSAYNTALQHAIARLIVTHPVYVMVNYAEKLGDVVGGVLRLYWPLLILLGLSLVVWRSAKCWRQCLLVSAPAVVIAAAPPMLAIPLAEYELPWIATFGILVFFALAGPVKSFERLIVERYRPRQGRATRALVRAADLGEFRRRPVWPAAAWQLPILAALVAGGALLSSASRGWDQRAQYAAAATPTELETSRPHAAPVASWSFARGIPPRWAEEPGVVLRRLGGAELVRTSSSAYQLAGPSLMLTPGSYALSVSGRIEAGGMSIGLLSASNDSWLGGGTGDFWYGQPQGGRLEMVIDISVSAATPVRAILSNWSPDGGTSKWLVAAVALQRLG